MLPENGDFPAFSHTGSLEHIDKLVAYAPADDIKDLNMALTILSYMPNFVLRWVVKRMENSAYDNSMLGTTFRQLDFGLRGLIFSCYYSGRMGKGYAGNDPLDLIGFELMRIED